jgi:hypothetical protein
VDRAADVIGQAHGSHGRFSRVNVSNRQQ